MFKPVIGNHIAMYPVGEKMSLFNKSTGKTYVIGINEARTISLFDGTRTIDEISRDSGIYSVDEIKKLIEALSGIGLFKPEKRKQHWFKIKLPVFNPNRLFKKDSYLTGVLFALIVYGSFILLLAGVSVNAAGFFGLLPKSNTPDQIIDEFMNLGVWEWVIIASGSLVCLALHEFGHTIAAHHYDVNVPEIGLMLYFFIPCAYTNISGINLLESRKKRVVVLLAGTFVNLELIGVFYLLLGYVDAHMGAVLLALIAANAVTVFTNGMVFIKHDGYYIAEVLLDEPMLRENAMNHLKETIINRKNKKKEIMTSNLSHVMYLMYSIVSLLYIPIMIAGTLITVFLPV